MGGSALRGMSFGKPVIIVGEQTFSAVLDSTTAPFFYYKGIYGLGSGGSSNARLVADIRRLAENRDERLALGHFARGFVVRHFGKVENSYLPNLQHYVGVLWLTIYDSPMLLPMASERQQFICENEGF